MVVLEWFPLRVSHRGETFATALLENNGSSGAEGLHTYKMKERIDLRRGV